MNIKITFRTEQNEDNFMVDPFVTVQDGDIISVYQITMDNYIFNTGKTFGSYSDIFEYEKTIEKIWFDVDVEKFYNFIKKYKKII